MADSELAPKFAPFFSFAGIAAAVKRQEQLMEQRSLALELQAWEPIGPISS
ncbi:ATPase, F0/V0 complex, subunit C [Penicillium camemberti]|uniref:ATPase, F0/V0 complex, subunit C n=1 Tax=Penicillium camemberti (strain FM 013) TaxID=1429867 RepID=A0A0G4PQE2_PENC3|nr:ATPase, F0/V0 complex, subunit C [Penicillium camemberti]